MSGRKFSDFVLSVWEYAGEVIAAGLVYVLLRIWFGSASISKFYADKQSAGAILVGIILASCIAVWVAFGALLSSEFGKWLRTTGNATVYSRAFAFPILVSLATLALLLTLSADTTAAHFVTIMVIYNLLNFITMIFNLHGLYRLWQEKDRTDHQHEAADGPHGDSHNKQP